MNSLVGKILYPRNHIQKLIGKQLKQIPLDKKHTKEIGILTDMVHKNLGVSIKKETIKGKLLDCLSFYHKSYSKKDDLTPKEMNHKIQSSLENSSFNVVTDAYVQDLQESLQGNVCIWLPSDAKDPDLEHTLNYFEEFDCEKGLNGDFPGKRYGCQCGVEIKQKEG